MSVSVLNMLKHNKLEFQVIYINFEKNQADCKELHEKISSDSYLAIKFKRKYFGVYVFSFFLWRELELIQGGL